ncbi:MAG: hypothetical protein CBCREVIR_3360 [Candidatus Burkholderia crenata]|nr:MAG: hypothetical protein CBCREVIR_3360 [Candidatus Burkholderia crenata]
MPFDHPLTGLAGIKPADLRGVPLIALVRRNDSRTTSDRVFTKAEVHPNIVIETTTATSSLDLVAEGIGVALLNAFPVHLLSHPRVVYLPFEPELSSETSFFTAAPDQVLSSFAQRYVEYVRDALPLQRPLRSALNAAPRIGRQPSLRARCGPHDTEPLNGFIRRSLHSKPPPRRPQTGIGGLAHAI